MASAPDLAGRPVACPRCGYRFVMPGRPMASGVIPPPLPPPPMAGTVPLQTGPPGMGEPQMAGVSAFQSNVSQRFKPAKSIFDIFDFRFETYVTPIIIRFTWGLALLGVLIYFGLELYVAVDRLMPKTEAAEVVADVEERIEFRMPEKSSKFNRSLTMVAFLTLRITLVLIMVLWVRVLLETSIVLFNIAMSLQSIDRKTK
jgi:hypothetical protein